MLPGTQPHCILHRVLICAITCMLCSSTNVQHSWYKAASTTGGSILTMSGKVVVQSDKEPLQGERQQQWHQFVVKSSTCAVSTVASCAGPIPSASPRLPASHRTKRVRRRSDFVYFDRTGVALCIVSTSSSSMLMRKLLSLLLLCVLIYSHSKSKKVSTKVLSRPSML